MRISNGLYGYSAYGLSIESSLPLPELLSKDVSLDPADVRICLGKVESHPEHIDETGHGFWARENNACYYLREVGTFLVSAGKHILVEPAPGATQESIRLSILGPVLTLALHQRGLFALHASSNSIDGAAVAFLGGHCWGKSTMAAILHARGYHMLSDDVTVLNRHDNTIVPGFPQLKLWPDAIRALGLSPDELPKLHPAIEKRALRFTHGFMPYPAQLRRLYILEIGQPITIEILRPVEALEEIIRHWYGSRFGPAFFDSLDLREYFLRVSALVRAIPVRRLRRPATLLDDPGLPEAIEREILQDLKAV